MNKYLILFMCFIISLMFVLYEDNSEVRDSIDYYDSVYVFNELDDTTMVSNPNTSDINIYYYFVILIYSLFIIISLVYDIKRINRYV